LGYIVYEGKFNLKNKKSYLCFIPIIVNVISRLRTCLEPYHDSKHKATVEHWLKKNFYIAVQVSKRSFIQLKIQKRKEVYQRTDVVCGEFG